MTKRTRIVLIIVATFALMVVGAAIWVYTSQWTIERAERMIEKETPLGSTIEAVDAMLTTHNIPHSAYQEGLDRGNFDDKPIRLKGVATGYIAASMKDVGYNPLIHWDIAMRFYFNG